MIDANGVLFVDNSTLKAVARCSTESVLRYAHGYTSVEERATLKSGSAGHEAIATYLRGEGREAATATFKAAYQEWADENVPPDDRLSYVNCAAILDYWLETHPLSTLPFRVNPKMVEIGFAYPLSEDVVLTGRVDATADDRDGSLRVVDHKFTGRINDTWKRKWRMDSGLTGYVWAAQQHAGDRVVGAYVNAIELSKLPSDPVRKCPKHATKYAECGVLHSNFELIVVDRTPEQIAEWKKTALHLAQRWRDLLTRFPKLSDLSRVRMQGTFHDACPFCAFYDFCWIGRPLDRVAGMLQYEPWEPWDYSQGGAATGRKP